MKKMDVVIAIILTAIAAVAIGFISGMVCGTLETRKIYDNIIEMAEEDMDSAINEILNEYEKEN